MTNDKLNRYEIFILRYWICVSKSFDSYFSLLITDSFSLLRRLSIMQLLWLPLSIIILAVMNFVGYWYYRISSWFRKCAYCTVISPVTFLSYFSEHAFAKCPFFKQAKQIPFCLINFLSAVVFPKWKDICLVNVFNQKIHLTLFCYFLWFEYSADE